MPVIITEAELVANRALRCDCGAEWQRCDPGQASDATSLPPVQGQSVLIFPGTETPPRIWCLACRPLVWEATSAGPWKV